MNRTELEARLAPCGQTHLAGFWDELDEAGRKNLANQIKSIDFSQLAELLRGDDAQYSWEDLAARAELPPALGLDEFHHGPQYQQAVETGSQALRDGEVAMILVAGGQGSRLGFNHPKGMYEIGPLSHRSLYQMIIEHLSARAKEFQSRIPLYIMTSPPTHAESESFLCGHEFFGFDPRDVQLFCQGVMPAVDLEGKLLLEDKDCLFVSPDGHGGTLAALARNGCLADMQARGIKTVFYGQVDNPLVQVCDPALIGYHLLRKSEMTTQVIRKNDPLQKVGNVVSVDGRVRIIEYSDLPEEYARQTNPDGSLKLWAGSIAVHVFDLVSTIMAMTIGTGDHVRPRQVATTGWFVDTIRSTGPGRTMAITASTSAAGIPIRRGATVAVEVGALLAC
jgi:UDP-N-acetylglucosamine/UDP-N-acetylgalactosamine diphosphorylase